MHGLGNDFVMIDASQFSADPPSVDFFTQICDRRHGVGCDQLVLYNEKQDSVGKGIIKAKFYNPDGSEAEICGNAARCLGFLMKKYHGLPEFILETVGGAYPVRCVGENEIRVEMGRPDFNLEAISRFSRTNSSSLSLLDALHMPKGLEVARAICISVGNPHLVLFCNRQLDKSEVVSAGTRLEKHPMFKNRINVGFAHVLSSDEISLFVFERGAGLTPACASGACAAAAAARALDFMSSYDITIVQSGGKLKIAVEKDLLISQTGSATYVFFGEIEV
jgi:diaminopimelate epimerase